MEQQREMEIPQEEDLIYALDIGTRSVIGMLGKVKEGKVHIFAMEKQPHQQRAMQDGQIEDIGQAAWAVVEVTRRLEKTAGRKLQRACVAAAGRALRTEEGTGTLELSGMETITQEQVARLEAAAVSDAERALQGEGEEGQRRLFLVGYTAIRYLLDDYPLTNLLGHKGQKLESRVVATFLPSEVIDSLYAVLEQAGLEAMSLTLEPIAALNAAIPQDLRLLNLALVDIGAGTSDIAVCREGTVVGYTMATVAGDEITEALMRAYLVDYDTAERMKMELGEMPQITFTDVLGLEQTYSAEEVMAAADGAAQNLASQVAEKIQKLNGGAPSALFLAGGGSKLSTLREKLAEALGMDSRRVALAGAHFKRSAQWDSSEMEDPEYTTPLGIAISAGLGLIGDSYRVFLNGKQAKLFRSGQLSVLEILMMNGYTYRELLGRNGKSVMLEVDGRRVVFPGQPAIPAQLKVNGKEVRPSTRVQAGDRIDFIPAQPGEDRVVLVREVMERVGARQLLAQGRPLAPDEPAPQGIPLRTAGKGENNPPASQQPAPQAMEHIASPVETGPQPSAPVPAVPAAAAPPARPLRLTFNGQSILLPGKADGNPYYVMDLLERSGIDFEKLDRPVTLRVNGRDGTFQQILQMDDQVEIRCDE